MIPCLVFLVGVLGAPVRDTLVNPYDHLDLFYGTDNGGNVFPGASRPFGMVKMGIDSGMGVTSGYTNNKNVTGISMMHESGTGGAPQYGVVSQLPFRNLKFDERAVATVQRKGDDVASPGYYSFETKDGIHVELAAADRAGLLSYQFPGKGNPKILVDLSHRLQSKLRPYWTQNFVEGEAYLNGDFSGYNGSLVFNNGWGEHTDWPVHFCVEFNNAAKTAYAWNKKSPKGKKWSRKKKPTRVATIGGTDDKQIVFEWDDSITNITAKQGVSHISIEQACQNMRDELPDFDVQALRAQSEAIWTKEVFSKISIQDYNDTLSGYVYNSLYGCHLMPTNKTGENNNWTNTTAPNYDDWFTIWDTFRSLNPLFNIINRVRSSEMVQSLVEMYKYDGWTPDGRSANQNGRTQGGSNSDVLMADAFVKNISNVDWDDAFAAMVKNAEVTPPNTRIDPVAPDSSNLQGRGALPDWLKYGYITRNFSRSVSRSMDYAYDDFALSVVAKGLGNSTAHEKYLKRSTNWQNLWNKDYKDSEYPYQGYIQPRNSDGTFNDTDYSPFSCGECYWKSDEYEGKPVEYMFSVPYDIETLIGLCGGNDTFAQRIDDMYALHGKSQVVDVGNEPSFLTPYLYNYINQQHRSVELVRWIVDNYFTTGSKGLPGNSDAGAFQSWLLLALSGFYPVAGTTTYLISSPFLPYMAYNLENGKKVEIKATGLSQTSVYVQSLKLNGKNHTQNWFEHSDLFESGGSLEFVLGEKPVVWETGPVPPSPGNLKQNYKQIKMKHKLSTS